MDSKYLYKRHEYDNKYIHSPKGKSKKAAFRNTPEQRIKIKARMAVNNARIRGKITRMECCVCGDIRVHAHHPDYTKPLEIIWLCPTHHKEAHKKEIK